MAHIHREGRLVLPRVAASAIGANLPVRASASAVNEVVLTTATNQRCLGLTVATAGTYQQGVSIQTEGVAKAIAGASVGVGAAVAIASTNGALGPVAAAASAPIPIGITQVGETVSAAAAGEVFSVLLTPGKVI